MTGHLIKDNGFFFYARSYTRNPCMLVTTDVCQFNVIFSVAVNKTCFKRSI